MSIVSNGYQESHIERRSDPHVHHWIISGQQGPISPAVCKLCGCHREFSNSFVRSWGRPIKRESPQAIQSKDKEVTVVSK